MRHLALRVRDIAQARAFYEGLLGMRAVWEPDPENVYLSFGADNLALHQIPRETADRYRAGEGQFLDHLGFVVENPGAVDEVLERMRRAGVPILKPPKRHRDGSYSFYMADPDGNVVQIIHIPGLG